MKTVFTNNEIVHVFNEQNQNEGRTSNGSMYFYNNEIYSYGSHYLLGEFLDNNTILINDKGYSNTTSKHISLLDNDYKFPLLQYQPCSFFTLNY